MNVNAIRIARWLGMASAVFAATPAFAQVEEIIVTARRREENLQQIPVSVSVLNEQRVQQEGIRDIADVAQLTPGLIFDTGVWASDTRVSIRGLFARAGRPSAAILVDGIDASGEALESSGGSALLNQRLLDVERIEVVKGPQSALYGRTAFAGAINYVTRRPSLDGWEFDGMVDGADYGQRELRAAISGPLSETFAFRLLGSSYHSDGFYRNQTNGEELGGGDSRGVALGLLWQPSDAFSAYLHTTYSDQEYDPMAVAVVPANEVRTMMVPAYDSSTGEPIGTRLGGLEMITGTVRAGERDVRISSDPRTGKNYSGTDDEVFRTNLILEWNLGRTTLKSLSSYLDADTGLQIDVSQQASGPGEEDDDGIVQQYEIGGVAGNPLVNYAGFNTAGDYLFKYEQFSQDIIWSSNYDDSRWSWLIGANYYQEEASSLNNTRLWYRDPNVTVSGLAMCNLPGVPCSYAESAPFGKTTYRDTTSYSAFGLVSFEIVENVTLTAEARVIYDEVEVYASNDRALNYQLGLPSSRPPIGPNPYGKVDDTNVVPRFSVDWRVNDGLTLYASAANGIKPPTFNTIDFIDPDILRVEKEDLWAYELGAKTTWLDGRLLFNAAAYYNDYQDQQVFIQYPAIEGLFPPTPRNGSANAAEVTVWGAELELLWLPTDNLTLSLGYAYNNGEYDSLVLSELVSRPNLVGIANQIRAGNDDGDFSGNDTIGSPDHSLAWQARYQRPMNGDISWFAQTTGQYQGERYADIANLIELEDYTVVNFQLGLEGSNWALIAYLDNAFDDDTIRYAQEFIDQRKGFTQMANTPAGFASMGFPASALAYLPDPRVFGVRFMVKVR